MSPELDEKLCNTYPKIFADRHKPMTETAMCWGFDVGDGWYNIIDALCANIQHRIDHTNSRRKSLLANNPYDAIIPEEAHQVIAVQVKEKFGTLRFYTDGGDDTVHALIGLAETMSARTCEVCGAPGKRRGRGWLYVSCDGHAKDGDNDQG